MTQPRSDAMPLVLLAEDDRDSLEMYAFALEVSGYRTTLAASGPEALARVAEAVPDVVVTDLSLPGGIDGSELCARLKADPRTSRVPVMALTGTAVTADLERARQAGCLRVLVKPLAPDRLADEISDVLTSLSATPAGSTPHDPRS